MGAQKDMGLAGYAQAFAAGGLAAFLFDYRSFGGSDGNPRHWVSPSRHVEDWRAAVAYVHTELTSTVDTSRICLWGTSFAGGHVLAIAQNTPGVTAIISQVRKGRGFSNPCQVAANTPWMQGYSLSTKHMRILRGGRRVGVSVSCLADLS